jgi:catechol 2,3-dioxygenase-like lactoylglutathione lyase family enzyme
MHYEAIDHVLFLAPDAAAAIAPYERLGLVFAPSPYAQAPLPSPAAGERALYMGREHNLFFLHFLNSPSVAQPGLAALALRVYDLRSALAALSHRGVKAQPRAVHDAAGARVADAAVLPVHDQAGAVLMLFQYVRPTPWRHAELRDRGQTSHSFPVRRLDHLAIVAPDLEGCSRYWSQTLGVPLSGEVKTPTLLIRQHKVGDAVIELLGAAGPDSPIHKRRPGLVSLASLEVSDLDAAIAAAQGHGFHPSEPAGGPLAATRIATLPPEEMGGLSLQLLEYLDLRREPLPGLPSLA